MDFDSFQESIQSDEAPVDSLSGALQGLWWDKKGDWAKAHELCQSADCTEGDWVHAYLHRVEGDEGNASYWYNRCRKPFYFGNVADEWEAIVKSLLS